LEEVFVSRLLAILMTITLSPVLLLVALLIKLESPGPAIFTQKRVGQFGRLFTIYKFRTMQIGTPDLPSDKVGEGDPRFTKSGKFLRRFSIDEFPQLFNIIKGEMVFIAPRPALHNQHELNAMRHMRGIDVLKPGITGWAQVNGRDSIPLETKVELDKYYLDFHNWQLDLKILWLTFFKTTTGEGLYNAQLAVDRNRARAQDHATIDYESGVLAEKKAVVAAGKEDSRSA
jgi:O-antigen biosynthesis protein WbqP